MLLSSTPSSLLFLLLLSTLSLSLASPSSSRAAVISSSSGGQPLTVDPSADGGELVLLPEGAEQEGGLGIEYGQSAGWVGWLSGWGWGEGELTVLHPNSSDSEVTFPSRAASFTPRISSFDLLNDSHSSSPNPDDPPPPSNPFLGLLLPIHHFPDPNHLSKNISGCPPIKPRPSSSHAPQVEEESFWFGELVAGGNNETGGDHHVSRNSSTLPLIALVVRGDCHFSEKVRWAQKMGAKAVVVGDSAEKGETDEVGRTRHTLINMAGLGDDTSDLRIPAVFVSRSTFLYLRDELLLSTLPSPGGLEVRLYEDLGWEWPLLDLLLLLLLLPSLLTLATLTLHHFRLVHKRHLDRAPPSIVDALQTRIWTTEGWEKEESSSDEEQEVYRHLESGAAGETSPLLPTNRGRTKDASSSEAHVSTSSLEEEEAGVASGSRPRTSPLAGGVGGADLEGGGSSRGGREASLDASGSSSNVRKTKKKKAQRPREYYSIEECSICLEDFQQGEVVRILPCGHVFHKDEIDGWLKGWKKLCPTCKADITIPPPHRPHPIKPRRAINTAPPRPPTATSTERTPLLAPTPIVPASVAATLEEDA
ncbi:hypothetical protein BDY24DRAFT_381175 [Mrakia frigida]|uniref:uncharacterized protein n=1 Tax=Mrakia frigida TaxID=29902 RepID=UPI003FCC0A92